MAARSMNPVRARFEVVVALYGALCSLTLSGLWLATDKHPTPGWVTSLIIVDAMTWWFCCRS